MQMGFWIRWAGFSNRPTGVAYENGALIHWHRANLRGMRRTKSNGADCNNPRFGRGKISPNIMLSNAPRTTDLVESVPMVDTSLPTTRVTLLAQLRQNPSDQASWDEFVERYGRHIYRWCRQWN